MLELELVPVPLLEPVLELEPALLRASGLGLAQQPGRPRGLMFASALGPEWAYWRAAQARR